MQSVPHVQKSLSIFLSMNKKNPSAEMNLKKFIIELTKKKNWKEFQNSFVKKFYPYLYNQPNWKEIYVYVKVCL